jgi:hypothetical protein
MTAMLLLAGSRVSPLAKVTCFPDKANATSGVQINIPVLDNDVDGASPIDDRTVRITVAPNNGTATALASGVITYKSAADFVGTATFKYIVKDTDGVDALAEATVTVTVAAAETFDAYSLNGSVNSPYTDRWATWIGTGASITSITGGVRVTAGASGGGDAVAVQMWNKTLFSPTDGTMLKFRLKRKDTGLGTAVTYPAMLFYWAEKGDGTAGHPTDPSSWTGATAATRWETNCDGFRMSIDGRDGTVGIAGSLEAQIRVRKQNRTAAGDSILGPTVTGPFILATDVAFDVTLTCVGGTFTATVTKVSDGTVLGTVTSTDTRYGTPIQGYVGIRAMETCDFEITNYEVSAAVDPGGGGGTGFQAEVGDVQTTPVITNCDTAADLQTYLDSYQDTGRTYKVPGNHRVVLRGNIVYDLAGDIVIKPKATGGPTTTQPWILCCNGDANRLKAKIGFKINVQAPSIIIWGLKFAPNKATVTRTGRIAFSGGNNNCKVQRCELTGWLPDNLGLVQDTNGHAIGFTGAGSNTLIERCYIHDPGPWGSGELAWKQNAQKSSWGSLRIFLRQDGNASNFQSNITVDKCMFASTIIRPIGGNYHSGQSDLFENGGGGTGYNANTNSGFIIKNSIFDGTGEGGAPIGCTDYGVDLGGEVDTQGAGVVDIKISQTTILNCTFRNFHNRGLTAAQNLDFRFGERGVVRQCYFDDANLGLAGGKHIVVSCKMVGTGSFKPYSGAIAWNAYTEGHQAADSQIFQDNNGTVNVGPGGDQFPANKTHFQGSHTGAIHCKPGHSYSPPAGFGTLTYPSGNNETNTDFSTTRSQPVLAVPTGPLSPDKVGPFCD